MREEHACTLKLSGETLAAWQDRLLSAHDLARLDVHVSACPACQRRVGQFADNERMLRGMRELDPSNRVWRNVQLRLPLSPQRRNFLMQTRTVWSSAAAAAALIVLAIVLSQVFQPHSSGPVSSSTPTVTSTATATSTATPVPPTATATLTPPNCNTSGSTFSSSYYATLPDPHYTKTQVYANIPLPPESRIVPDDAAGGVRGYMICSAGTIESITSFMNTHLADLGWTAGSGGTFTKSGYSLTVRVDAATSWVISWRDPDIA